MLKIPCCTTIFSLLLLLFPYTVLILFDNYRLSLPKAIPPHVQATGWWATLMRQNSRQEAATESCRIK